jgi:hypothetical protein
MATVLSVIANSRTPLNAVLFITNANGAEGAPPLPNLTRAVLTAASTQANALADGPLKELIRRTHDLSVFNVVGGNDAANDYIRITCLAGGIDLTLNPPTNTCILNWTHDALEASIASENEGAAEGQILVELRLEHSKER